MEQHPFFLQSNEENKHIAIVHGTARRPRRHTVKKPSVPASKKHLWVFPVIVAFVLLCGNFYALFSAPKYFTIDRFISYFNHTLPAPLHLSSNREDFEIYSFQDLVCVRIPFETHAFPEVFVFLGEKSDRIQYVRIDELPRSFDQPSTLPQFGIYLNNIAYPYRFYENKAIFNSLTALCSGETTSIGDPRCVKNGLCAGALQSYQYEGKTYYHRSFFFSFPHPADGRDFSFFYPNFEAR